MLFQLVIVVNSREIPLGIYFKREETFDMWVKHHYLTLAALIDVLSGTKEFDVLKKRVK